MDALVDVLKTKMIKRGVPVKNLKVGDVEPPPARACGAPSRLTQGIPQDVSKRMVKAIKEQASRKSRPGSRATRSG